jgi:hypothetical protein
MEKKDQELSAEALLMQQYPSPTTDGHDTAYYEDHSRDQRVLSVDPGMEPPVEPPTPQQEERRPSVNVEELQLAAQLVKDLTPAMMEAPVGHEHPSAGRQAHEEALAHREPSGQAQEPALHIHDPRLQHQDPALQHQDVSIHNVLPAPVAEPQQSSYMHVAAQPHHPSLPQALHMQMSHQAYANTAMDTTPPRKRSKVSRACDECRRKKVKCDAQSEKEPCTNCRKGLIKCEFSRIPQKRGPSKG